MVILGLGHKARRGKNTVAQAIVDARGGELDIKQYGFGDLLKKEVNDAAVAAGGMFPLFQKLQLNGIPLPNGHRLALDAWVRYDAEAPMDDPLCPLGKQRKLLQWWGTEYRRVGCNKFYWVAAMKERLLADKPQVAIINDVRFWNEFLWVKANKGFTIRVERPGCHELDTNSTHPSEHELDNAKFDIDIINEGELEELKADAVRAFDIITQSLRPVELPDAA